MAHVRDILYFPEVRRRFVWTVALLCVSWGALDLRDGLEPLFVIRPEEPPGAGQPSRLLPAPRGPSGHARAYSDPGLEAT